jgi:hypothetical protein
MGGMRKVYKILVGKAERERPLGRPRRRWEDWLRIGTSEHGNERTGSKKGREFFQTLCSMELGVTTTQQGDA